MATPTVHTLLNGYLMPTDQGNPAFCAVYLIESYDGRIVFDSVMSVAARRCWPRCASAA